MDEAQESIIRGRLCQWYGLSPDELAHLSGEDQGAMLDYIFDPSSQSTAIRVINALNDAELPIPTIILKPWIKEATEAVSQLPDIKREIREIKDALSRQPRFKRKHKSESTKGKQRDAVFFVVMRMSFSYSRDEAIAKVASEMGCKADTVLGWYKDNPKWRDAAWGYARDNPDGRTRLAPRGG